MTDPFIPSDEENENRTADEAIDNLDTFVSSLDFGKKRKTQEDNTEVEDPTPAPRKRRMLKERTEAGPEGEFRVQPVSGLKLQLEDLLAPLASTSSLQTLKKSIKPLAHADSLPAPLPTRTQERIDREAAYEQTKEEVDKWKATMKRIKEADHLSFPLQVPQKIMTSNAGLAAKFKPSNDMENAVDKLLRAANLRDDADINKTEELEMNHLSVEEVARRRAELRKMRDFIFYAELKAKRAAKVKSKTYRKIHKKTKEKMKNMLKGADGEEHVDDEEERMQAEVDRARQRATLRHKKTGKWAKSANEAEGYQRKEIEEKLDKDERLREQIKGIVSSDDEDDEKDEEGEEEEQEEVETHEINSPVERLRPSPTPLQDIQPTDASNPWLQPRESKGDAESSRLDQLIEMQPLELPTLQTGSEGSASGGAGRIPASFQRDLVALAFAGDNVVEDFAKLKKREVEQDAPREEDHTLPGWGTWAGKGVKQNPNAKKVIKKIAGIEPSSRADHGKPHLIISEKRDKKAAKYLVKDLPYPYTSKAQFERSMEVPLGAEWNTRQGFQRGTLPRVVKKMGTVIDPLKKVF